MISNICVKYKGDTVGITLAYECTNSKKSIKTSVGWDISGRKAAKLGTFYRQMQCRDHFFGIDRCECHKSPVGLFTIV